MEYIEMLKVYVISDGFCLELVCYDIVIRLLLSIGWKKNIGGLKYSGIFVRKYDSWINEFFVVK